LNILILGAGQVGSELTEILSEDGHSITLVDLDEEKLEKESEQHDIKIVSGNCCYPQTLEDANIQDTELAIAMTEWDEVNLVACQMIKHLNKKTRTMARIRAREYLKGKGNKIFENGEYSIDVLISPETLITEYISKLVQLPGALQVLDFGDGRASMVSVKAVENAPITGHKISELREHIPNADARVAAIYREEEIIIPSGEDYIKDGDEVYFISARANIKKVMSEIRPADSKHKSIMIAGGGKIGRRLAKILEDKFSVVKIIEKSRKRGDYLSENLDHALVLNGDATDEDLLIEEGIEQIDMFCSVTDSDEANVMSSLLAKKLGAKKVLSLMNKQSFLDLIHQGEVDITVIPNEITIGVVLKNITKAKIERAHTFKKGKSEALELIASQEITPKIIGKGVDDIKLPNGCTISAIIREKEVKIAHHDVKIHENDHLIIFLSDKKLFPALETSLMN
jgi:trk system potassium uptake protein TrkA|tara:strand:- start:1958 stop:3322 length:1365 start_codon:yes stop_codon:yes gene_type:complete